MIGAPGIWVGGWLSRDSCRQPTSHKTPTNPTNGVWGRDRGGGARVLAVLRQLFPTPGMADVMWFGGGLSRDSFRQTASPQPSIVYHIIP